MIKKKVLIIDDDRDLIESVKAGLEETGLYSVMGEVGGVKGILTARAFQPDMILLDVMMPDLSGNEVAQNLMDDPLTKHIPVAYFTVIVCKEELESHGGVIGGHRFISKPSTIEELVRSIEETISTARE